MTLDLVGRGSRRAAYSADAGTRDGRTGGDARRIDDASGALVTPGFTDIHCHHDARSSWPKGSRA